MMGGGGEHYRSGVAKPMRRRSRRTWAHPGEKAWRPLGVQRRECGCWWDIFGDRMWEPCVVHEAEGHLSGISPGEDGLTVVRCLVGVCPWQESWAQEHWAAQAAVRHWEETRAAAHA